jgi:hypothetical protein
MGDKNHHTYSKITGLQQLHQTHIPARKTGGGWHQTIVFFCNCVVWPCRRWPQTLGSRRGLHTGGREAVPPLCTCNQQSLIHISTTTSGPDCLKPIIFKNLPLRENLSFIYRNGASSAERGEALSHDDGSVARFLHLKMWELCTDCRWTYVVI